MTNNQITYKRLGDYIREVNVRNRELRVTQLLGLSIEKRFIPSIANTIGTDMAGYKVVCEGQFAYVPVTSRNGEKITVALLEDCDERFRDLMMEKVEAELEKEPNFIQMSYGYDCFDYDHPEIYGEVSKKTFEDEFLRQTPVANLRKIL